MFCPSLHLKWSDLKNFFTNRVVFEKIVLSNNIPMLGSKLSISSRFLFISILFVIGLQKPYFLLFKDNFDSLEWQFGSFCFYVDLETFSKIKLKCVPTYYYWSNPFFSVNSIFNTAESLQQCYTNHPVVFVSIISIVCVIYSIFVICIIADRC